MRALFEFISPFESRCQRVWLPSDKSLLPQLNMLPINALRLVLSTWLASSYVLAAVTNLSSALSPSPKIFSLGINCRGSFWCPWFREPSNGILRYLLDWMKAEMHDEDVYFNSAHIACASLYAERDVKGAAFCVYTQGHNVPRSGINGSEIKRKLTQLSEHGCFACGSVPLAEDNDPNALGILTLNYVLEEKCKPFSDRKTPICKPSIPAAAGSQDSQPFTATSPNFHVFNLTDVDAAAPIAAIG